MSKQNLDTVDTNVDNYTTDELLKILDLNPLNPDKDDMIKKSNKYIQQFTNENNKNMSFFFQDIQKRLNSYIDDYFILTNETTEQTNEWFQNESISQRDNPVQKDKITDRFQKIDVYDDVYNEQQMPFKRNELGVSNVKVVDVQQDKLNPVLKNTITRIVNIDSKYRESDGLNYKQSNTNFTIDLSEHLTNVLSMRIYSIQVPQTWYSIDTVYNNTCFFISFYSSTGEFETSVSISLEPGNYSIQKNSDINIVTNLTQAFTNAGFEFSTASPYADTPVSYNYVNGKMTFYLYGGTYTSDGIVYTIDTNTIINFYDPNGKYNCEYACGQVNAINGTLGWLLGFRVPFMNVLAEGNKGSGIVDLYGPRYLMLIIDDLNQNHINNGVIVIAQSNKTLKLPVYYSPDLPYVCNKANPSGTIFQSQNTQLQSDPDIGILLADKFDGNYTKTVTVLPSAPRTLTQAQIYSINEIMKNNSMNDNYRLQAPTHSDLLAIIPLSYKTMTTGDLILIDSSTLQLNARTYFGPVNVERMHIQLMDDRGNLLNLNEANWSITLICECLYQY